MSSDKSEEDEHEVISKQIVDYYKKYSQSKQLPKYFSGTSLSYMPEIVKEDEIITKSKPITVLDETNSETLVQKESVPLIQVDEPVEHKPVSPASSITSNRKLEWDNGADIGYNNCNKNIKLHKSVSLPILLNSVDVNNVDQKGIDRLCTEIVTVVSYCGDGRGDDKQIQSSSSSPSYRAEVPIESSSSSNKTNPKPISTSSSSFTSTLAYLKTKIGTPDAESTPKLPFYAETPIVPKRKKERKKIVNLCMTKPVLIECLDNQKKKGSDKKIQTTFIENVSKCVQTTDSLEIVTETPKNQIPGTIENQSVILISYDSESDKRTCSSNTQTDGELIASQCDSFEYYKDEYGEAPQNGALKRSSPKSDLAASTDSSQDLPILGELISKNQSKSVIGDVERSIELLQKLLKSKKYDETTKKRYIKKIVEKIVDTKYGEDSTTSSELFIPKKQQLQENVPWHPPQLSKFTVKTFSDEFLPSEEKKSLVVNQSDENKSSLDTDQTGTSLERQNTSSGSYQSWKEDKTLSERILEEKQRGQGDHLVKYALKEREHQINWIKDEISHLTKLKGLLEKKVQRTTTVYMVSQQYDHFGQNPCDCVCPRRNPPRNYVIQTELSSSSSEVPREYNLHDQGGRRRYRVTQGSSESEPLNIDVKVVGDIEVVSDDKTTNIKVKAKRVDTKDAADFRSKKPVLIGGGKYDTFPKSKTEERCLPCGRVRKLTASPVDGRGGKKLSFDVPLDSKSSLSNKISNLANNVKAGSSVGDHKCKCMEFLNKKIKDTESLQPPLMPVLPQTDLDRRCHCCGRKKPIKLQTDNTKCQTDDCKCCNKQIQTSVSSRDESVEIRPELRSKKTSDHDRPCQCCRRQKPTKLQTGNTKCQTDDCKCCNKQIQTSVANRDESVGIRPELRSKKTSNHGRPQPAKLRTDNTKCQTDDCNCCNKQVQTSVASKDESVGIRPELCSNATSDYDCYRGQKLQTDNTKCQTDDCNCCNKQVQTEICSEVCSGRSKTSSESSDSSSFSSETASSSSNTVRSCICCKRQNVTSNRLYTLRKKLSDQAYPLCRPCYRQNRRSVCSPNVFTNPGHICNCYTVVETKTLNEIRETINDLNELDRYCTCVNGDNRSSSDYCKYCKCKLRKTSKNRNGIAYMLTFEDGSFKEDTEKKKHKKKHHLEEIKIKIPVSYKKKHKEKENKRKKAKHSESQASSSTDEKKNSYDLQGYLNQNRPDFVQDADCRRNTMNQARMQREESSDHNKLMFLKKCQEECEKNSKRLFSAKEMKEITKRNYKKLPEVQKKLNDNRDRQLKQASRLMADTFNKKLRENVLRGKRNLPTDVNVVDM